MCQGEAGQEEESRGGVRVAVALYWRPSILLMRCMTESFSGL